MKLFNLFFRSRFLNRAITPRYVVASLILFLAISGHAQNQYVGEIKMFAGNFAPTGWATCDGQLLSIAQNTALFSILGTTYGGDGTTTFALPDLRGRFPMHFGAGSGRTARTLGASGGAEQVTLTTAQMPAHTHTITVTTVADSTIGTSDKPKGALPARNASATPQYGTQSNSQMAATAVTAVAAVSGSSQPHSIMPPYETVTFIIALQGIFPSRN